MICERCISCSYSFIFQRPLQLVTIFAKLPELSCKKSFLALAFYVAAIKPVLNKMYVFPLSLIKMPLLYGRINIIKKTDLMELDRVLGPYFVVHFFVYFLVLQSFHWVKTWSHRA